MIQKEQAKVFDITISCPGFTIRQAITSEEDIVILTSATEIILRRAKAFLTQDNTETEQKSITTTP
jgi:hypothetical protein